MSDRPRFYTGVLQDHLQRHRQMALISGPRQVGKTTVCRALGDAYFNWDNTDDRRLLLRGPAALAAALHLNRLRAKPPVAVLARVSRALERFGLGSSTAAVDEALDYLTNKELGQSARYFNQTGKAQFNQQQITHAVLSFMAGKEQQRHMTDLPIHEEDHDDASPEGVRACHLADPGHIRPDEYAARRDALRAIAAMIPDTERELYSLMLAVREPGMLDRIHAYADRHQIGRSTVYFRIKKLAEAIQLHPWFDEITAPFRTDSRTA